MNSQALPARAKTLDLFTGIAPHLQLVEAAIEQALETDEPLLAEVSTHLLRAGGKRIRPAMVLLSAQFPGADFERVLPVAAAAEMIHMATLVHDDVVDKADTRRGRPTVNALWSNQVSVLTGDYLFAKAFSMFAQTGNNRVVKIMADVVFEMSKGELAQIESYFQSAQTEAQYYKRIAQKTGYLLAECCRLGAIMSGADDGAVQALYTYGYELGLSFQIIDDILDWEGSSSKVGKPVGSDLKVGILTLPVLHALENAGARAELKRRIDTREVSDSDVAWAKEQLVAAGSLKFAHARAQEHYRNACAQLDRVPTLASRETMQVLADFVVNREF